MKPIIKEKEMQSLSETFKDSKSNFVLLAAAALDAENSNKKLIAHCKYLEQFIQSTMSEHEGERFCDPTDEFGSIPIKIH